MATRHLELTYPIKLWVLRPLGAAGDAWAFDCVTRTGARVARSKAVCLAWRQALDRVS